MDIPLNVDVHCVDGRCGRSTHIILNPISKQVTHFVVREQWPSRVERLTPVKWVAASTREIIVLKQTREQFNQLEPFNQTEFIYADVPHHATDPKLTLIWPYAVPAKRLVDEKMRRIPPGELAVRRGARVRATDGRIGRVDELLVDPEDGQITHLALREGHLWGERVVTISVSQIDRIEENVVQLKVDKKSVEQMPSIPVKRSWR